MPSYHIRYIKNSHILQKGDIPKYVFEYFKNEKKKKGINLKKIDDSLYYELDNVEIYEYRTGKKIRYKARPKSHYKLEVKKEGKYKSLYPSGIKAEGIYKFDEFKDESSIKMFKSGQRYYTYSIELDILEECNNVELAIFQMIDAIADDFDSEFYYLKFRKVMITVRVEWNLHSALCGAFITEGKPFFQRRMSRTLFDAFTKSYDANHTSMFEMMREFFKYFKESKSYKIHFAEITIMIEE